MKHETSPFAATLTTTLLLAVCQGPGKAVATENAHPSSMPKSPTTEVAFPEGYRDTFTNYLSLDRVQNPDQVIRLFANDTALRGPDENDELPFGSVIVGEVYKAKLDADGEVMVSGLGRRIRDELVLIAVMERGEGLGQGHAAELRNGHWEFAAYKPDGSVANKNLDTCRSCHAPLVESDHLFSLDHLRKEWATQDSKSQPIASTAAARGKQAFQGTCTACHQVGPSAINRTGPVLNGVVGRRAGTFAGFDYSEDLTSAGESGLTWDETTLFEWLAGPSELLKSHLGDPKARSKMPVSIEDPSTRRDLIAYLSTLSKDSRDR
ncbi:MAG: cytochrome P460 family protein [Acidobacteriota bacterium]